MLVLGVYAGVVAVLMAATTVATGGIVSNANGVVAHAGWFKRLADVVMIVAGVGQRYLSLIIY